MVDVHSHILPALDDGSKSMEESLEMLRIAYDEGIRTMIATPHNMPGKGCPDREKVEKRLSDLRTAAASAGIRMKILLGTEYFYRSDLLEEFEEGRVITMNDTRYVLIEFDLGVNRTYAKNAVREIMALDYRPVIAHVERYPALMERKAEAVKELRAMGALIQVNSGSVIGNIGFKVKQSVKYLLQNGLVDLIGSDAHSSRHRAPRMKECAKYLRKKYNEDYCEHLLTAAALYE
ncbi:MAG: CpsB/CapC family capsule biosynthesis tyrosine phosphatase [Acetatifactor sp.]